MHYLTQIISVDEYIRLYLVEIKGWKTSTVTFKRIKRSGSTTGSQQWLQIRIILELIEQILKLSQDILNMNFQDVDLRRFSMKKKNHMN